MLYDLGQSLNVPVLIFLTGEMEIMKHIRFMRRMTLVNMYRVLRILPVNTKCSVNISHEYYAFVGEEI